MRPRRLKLTVTIFRRCVSLAVRVLISQSIIEYMSLCCTYPPCAVSRDKRQEATVDRRAEGQASDSDLLRSAHACLARPFHCGCGEAICVEDQRREEDRRREKRVGRGHEVSEEVYQGE